MNAEFAFPLWGLGAVVALIGAAYLAGRLIVLAVGERPPRSAQAATSREVVFGFVVCPRNGEAVHLAECLSCPWLRAVDRCERPQFVVCGATSTSSRTP